MYCSQREGSSSWSSASSAEDRNTFRYLPYVCPNIGRQNCREDAALASDNGNTAKGHNRFHAASRVCNRIGIGEGRGNQHQSDYHADHRHTAKYLIGRPANKGCFFKQVSASPTGMAVVPTRFHGNILPHSFARQAPSPRPEAFPLPFPC